MIEAAALPWYFKPGRVAGRSANFQGYTDWQLVRMARGAPPKRSAFASLLRHGDASAPVIKVPIPVTRAADPMPAPPPLDASDACIRRAAQRLAAYCVAPVPGAADDMECLAHLYRVCRLQHVEPPALDPSKPAGPVIARLAHPRWWRRRLRVSVARRTEERRIAAGVVHRAAQCYCSDSGVYRRRESAKRNSDMMRLMIAVNEHGESFTVGDLAEKSTSNPVLRRNELMTRCKGLETIADARGDRGLFVTWTLPSRFHAVLSSGHRNPNYDRSTPRAGSAFFGLQWARVRAALAKAVIPAVKKKNGEIKWPELRGLRLYGIRVAEPHHDETPHWHLLLFAPLRWHRMIAATIAQYAFVEGDEPGAKKARIDAKLIQKGIDPATGKERSAVGYVAKYLAKNVDGFQVEIAMEKGADGELHFTGDGATAAERIRAWASTWGIRQFQFFGTPPVTIWRELRRLDGEVGFGAMEAARAAADAGDYAAHVQAIGGVSVPKLSRPLQVHRQVRMKGGEPVPTMYGDEAPEVVKGVSEFAAELSPRAAGVLRHLSIAEAALKLKRRDRRGLEAIRRCVDVVITRIHEWTVLFKPEGAELAPRTRVNNCNRSIEHDHEKAEAEALETRQPQRWIDPEACGGILSALGWSDDRAGWIGDDLECLAEAG